MYKLRKSPEAKTILNRYAKFAVSSCSIRHRAGEYWSELNAEPHTIKYLDVSADGLALGIYVADGRLSFIYMHIADLDLDPVLVVPVGFGYNLFIGHEWITASFIPHSNRAVVITEPMQSEQDIRYAPRMKDDLDSPFNIISLDRYGEDDGLLPAFNGYLELPIATEPVRLARLGRELKFATSFLAATTWVDKNGDGFLATLSHDGTLQVRKTAGQDGEATFSPLADTYKWNSYQLFYWRNANSVIATCNFCLFERSTAVYLWDLNGLSKRTTVNL